MPFDNFTHETQARPRAWAVGTIVVKALENSKYTILEFFRDAYAVIFYVESAWLCF